MGWLLDTNILSELRRRQCNPRVRAWVAARDARELWISVMSVAEIRQGIETKRLSDPAQAAIIERWLDLLRSEYAGRFLPVTEEIADRWGKLSPTQRLPGVDGFIAATAIEHGLAVATRNVGDFERCGVPVVNPFEENEAHD